MLAVKRGPRRQIQPQERFERKNNITQPDPLGPSIIHENHTSIFFALTLTSCSFASLLFSKETKDGRAEKKNLILTEAEQGELLGALGFGALVLDAFYEISLANGHRSDNHLQGIDNLAKERWGITYSEIAKTQEKHSGRDFRREAHVLVHKMIKDFGGADKPAMKKWLLGLEDRHNQNLNKLHSLAPKE